MENSLNHPHSLDDDFARSLYERAMRDPRHITQALSDISTAFQAMHVELDGTISRLQEIFAALQANLHGIPNQEDPRRESVAVTTRAGHHLHPGSKKQRVVAIVAELTKGERRTVRTAEILAAMERLDLFQNVHGSRRESVANTLFLLRRSGHLATEGAGNYRLPIEDQQRPSEPLPRGKATRPGSKRDQCAELLKQMCENETRSAKRSEIKKVWIEAGLFDESQNIESAVSGMLLHLKNYAYVTTDNRGTWTWIGLR